MLFSNCLFPLYHFLKRDGLWAVIKSYEKNQWLNPEEIRKMQANKLKLLLRHCERNVPYYKAVFSKCGVNSENLTHYDMFRKLPFLTKKIINMEKESLIALDSDEHSLIANSTSGSTGENLHFYQDMTSGLHRQAVVWRSQKWVSCHYADRQAFLWGAPFDLERTKTLGGKIHSFFNRSLNLSSYELSDESMAIYVDVLNKFKPRLFVSYPSPLTTFAEFLSDRNLRIPSVQSIITSAETLYDWQRKIIESVFNCPVFDRYGCREFGNIAHECEKHEGYHINSDRFYLEILKNDGLPAGQGEIGEMVITDLDNYGFPFIRYKIGDMAVPSEKICSCGRGLPLLEKLQGRSFDIVTAPKGNRIAGTFWTLALRSVPGVNNFQVEQILLDKLTVRIVPGKDYSQASEKKIIELIQEKCGREMDINITCVDEIPLTKSGKLRFVISRIENE